MSTTPLPAIAGERLQGGITFGFDNYLSQTAARGVTLPTDAAGIPTSGDWCHVLDFIWFGGHYSNASNSRQALLSFGVGASGTFGINAGHIAVDTARPHSSNDGRFELQMQKRSTNDGGTAEFLPSGTTVGTPVALGIFVSPMRRYLLAIRQTGNIPSVRVIDCETGAVQTYTGSDNRTGNNTFYNNGTGSLRPASFFQNFLATVGRHTGSSTLYGFNGAIGFFANIHGTVSDATLDSLASGATGIGTLSGLRYINLLRPDASLATCPAEATDRFGTALPVTGAGTIIRTGFSQGPWPYGPLRTGAQISLQVEHHEYIFPMMPGRSTGRVWFDGTCSAATYPIYGRLVRVSDGSELLPWTQLTAAHPGGAFRHSVDGIPPAVPFYREVWVGPAASTKGGADGHLFAERNRMALGLKIISAQQSQGNYDLNPNGDGSGTGSNVAPSIPAGLWMNVKVGQRGTGAYSRSDAPLSYYGPRSVRELTGLFGIGDGIQEALNRFVALQPWPIEMIQVPRSGHGINNITYDRTTVTGLAATGTGTTRSATLVVTPPNGATIGTTGVEPGSIVVTTANFGTFTDAANASMTGTQLTAANPQAFPASGALSSGTINYQTSVLSLTFTGDPGAVTVSFMTRYDTTEGNENTETTPDKFTWFGSTMANGAVRRVIGLYSPRHGFSFIEWSGHTSSTGYHTSTTAAQYANSKDGRRISMQLLVQRIWALADGTNPPMMLGQSMRGTGNEINSTVHIRRADFENAQDYGYNPASATDGNAGATTSNFLWFMGSRLAISLENNAGEHQDSQSTGGRRRGAVWGMGAYSLMTANQSRALGPRAVSAVRRAGAPNIIDVSFQFRPGATALTIDGARTGTAGSIPAGNPNALPEWYVYENPSFFAFQDTTGVALTARINAAGTGIELQRSSGNWPDPSTTPILIYSYTGGPFLGHALYPLAGSGNRLTAETQMASMVFDNGGDAGAVMPGAMALPVYALQVSAGAAAVDISPAAALLTLAAAQPAVLGNTALAPAASGLGLVVAQPTTLAAAGLVPAAATLSAFASQAALSATPDITLAPNGATLSLAIAGTTASAGTTLAPAGATLGLSASAAALVAGAALTPAGIHVDMSASAAGVTAAQIADPTLAPVSLAEAKAHLRLGPDENQDDELIASFIRAAAALIEQHTGLVMRARPLTLSYPVFGARVVLYKRPVQTVEAVEYDDAATGDVLELDADNWRMREWAGQPSLQPAFGKAFPASDKVDGAVRVTFTAGYLSNDHVPEDIRQAALQLIAHWYANREAVSAGNITSELPFGVKALLFNHRRGMLA